MMITRQIQEVLPRNGVVELDPHDALRGGRSHATGMKATESGKKEAKKEPRAGKAPKK